MDRELGERYKGRSPFATSLLDTFMEPPVCWQIKNPLHFFSSSQILQRVFLPTMEMIIAEKHDSGDHHVYVGRRFSGGDDRDLRHREGRHDGVPQPDIGGAMICPNVSQHPEATYMKQFCDL